MKKYLSTIVMLCVAALCQAQTATAIFDKMVSTFKASGTVSASYSMNGSKGTIVMQGAKFRILAGDDSGPAKAVHTLPRLSVPFIKGNVRNRSGLYRIDLLQKLIGKRADDQLCEQVSRYGAVH